MNIGFSSELNIDNAASNGQAYPLWQKETPTTHDLLSITQKLHASLDPRIVFTSFAKMIAQTLPLAGVQISIQGQHFQWGKSGNIKLNHTLKWKLINQQVMISYNLQSSLNKPQYNLLEQVEPLLLQPLSNAIAYQNMSRKAMIDTLTGLGNRRDFERAFRKSSSRSKRTGQKFSLLILDLDNFKMLNDQQGHQFGDKVLQKFSHLLDDAVRICDQTFRIGGDEFVIILEGDKQACDVLCKRILTNLEQHQWLSKYQIQVSIGGAEFKPQFNPTELYETADQALYQIKNAGRNGYQLAD